MVRRFKDAQDGFVLLMSLLILPIFLGLGLFLIDVGRHNNAHTDLQTVVDAMALAGARELDGNGGARARAQTAMTKIANPVSMLSTGNSPTKNIRYVSGDTRFTITFLDSIPTDDMDPIDGTYTATSDADAAYVRVQAYDTTEFGLETLASKLLGGPGSIPVGTEAVATAEAAICDVPPLFICNPFEFVGTTYDPSELQNRFMAGDLHGRMIRLHPGGGNTAFPGNFGFLQVNGAMGTNAIREYFAGGSVPICVRDGDTVDTAPGSRIAMADGINVRFDVMPGPQYGNQALGYIPAIAENVRKGYSPHVNGSGNANDCVSNGGGPNSGGWSDDHIIDLSNGWPTDANGVLLTDSYTGIDGTADGAYGFPDNNAMVHPSVTGGTPGAYVGTDSNWPLQTYLDKNYGVGTYTVGTTSPNIGSIYDGTNWETVSSFSGRIPSRYDIYRWEIANGLTSTRGPSPGDESGAPLCSTSDFSRTIPSITASDPTEDPRVLAVAIIDCVQEAESGAGGNTDLNVNTYASIFLSRPMRSWFPSSDQTIDVEVIDVLGYGGNGTLETFLREESVLVR